MGLASDLLKDIIDDGILKLKKYDNDNNKKAVYDSVDKAEKVITYVKGLSRRLTIKKMASGIICEYPMLSSNSLSIESLSILTKALEHEYVNLLALVLSDKIEIGTTLDSGVSEVLKKYHTNVKVESANIDLENSIVSDLKFNIIYEDNNDVNRLYQELNTIYINESSLNEDTILSDFTNVLNEKRGSVNPNSRDFDPDLLNPDSDKFDRRARRNYNTSINKNANIVKDQNKKINSLAPTVVEIEIMFAVKDHSSNVINNVRKKVRFGVKGVLHVLPSSEIIYNISKKLDDGNWMMKFIKWRTGELKFFKDILFEIDESKRKAKKNVKNRLAIWDSLSKMSSKNKIKNLLGSNKSLVATTTLIITKDEVERIKETSGLNLLENTNNVIRLMNGYFLLGFCIVDEPSNIVYLFNENTRSFEYYNFNSLKAFGKEEINVNQLNSLYH